MGAIRGVSAQGLLLVVTSLLLLLLPPRGAAQLLDRETLLFAPKLPTTRRARISPPCLRAPAEPDPRVADLVVVPAVWNEVLPAWPGFRVWLYQRHDASRACFSPNKGLEAGVYLQYIVERYDALPARAVFVHGVPFDHQPDMYAWARCLRRDVAFAHLNTYRSSVRTAAPFGGRAHWDAMARIMGKALPAPGRLKLSTVCCGQFAASRAQIRSHPRWRYEKLLAHVRNATSDRDVAVAFEYLVGYLVGDQPLYTARKPRDYCADFQPAANCTGSPCVEGGDERGGANLRFSRPPDPA